ncbi:MULTISPECIES: hypothetical protein [Streptomyces]|uniref:hypothetical protein n=1 Tax=Streptomyces TaxID=1883 RepID=UPI001CCAA46A|nr:MULTISPECIES: hypothetical protein [Streptomyces]MBZ6132193.1 hypothetical protein [Streptomyces olivaceus]MBZ6250310.1 hypothetical protein [Streptomyces olivaceus]MCM8553370.1 hypothetical protein [Streptomyces sp. STCH 565 A]
MRTTWADRPASGPVGAVLALAGIAAGVLVGDGGLDTVVGCGFPSDGYPSQTAKDWVTGADHVVVATPTAEKDTNRRDFDEGAIRYQTDRAVTFRTDDVLWSSQQPRHALGQDFEMVAAGWRVHRESGDRAKRTTAAAPRLEPGHTYLLALRWVTDQWVVLGEGASVPYDQGTVGRGEWCGRTLSEDDVARGERFSRVDDHSLEKTAHGKDEQAVRQELERAGAHPRTGSR